MPDRPLGRAVTLRAARGRVERRVGMEPGGWKPFTTGETVVELRGLRVQGRGAMLSIGGRGQSSGRLWVRGGSELKLGQTEEGEIRLALLTGEARADLRDLDLKAKLVDHQRLVDISGGDHLFRTRQAASPVSGSALLMADTAQLPGSVDWTLTLQGEPEPAGLGTLTAGGGSDKHLNLRRVLVKVRTVGDVAETRVEHVFFNPTEARMEGTFRFPMPERASIVGLAMEINNRLMEGELVEREKARKTYEDIVAAMQDPALLEWEQGNMFKLRVFPIEPRSEKRIVLRYVAPLDRGPAGPEYRYDTAAPAFQGRIPRFGLEFDGKRVVDVKDFRPGRQFVIPVDTGQVAPVLVERRKDGTYTALRIRPDWSRVPAVNARKHTGRDVLVMVDTSRSSLETRNLALQTLRTILTSLHSSDRFVVMAFDLTVRSHADRFVAAGATEVRKAEGFVKAIEPDGATDLGLAFKRAGERARAARARPGAPTRTLQIVYIGDGTATWGETEPEVLRRAAETAFGKLPFHAVIMGKGASAGLLRDIAAQHGGQAIKPRTLLQVRRFALRLSHAAHTNRLRKVLITGGEEDEIYPARPATLFNGEELTVLVRTPAGSDPPSRVTLTAESGGVRVSQSFPVTAPAGARHVAHRWAMHRIAHLQAEGAGKDKIVPLSLRYGVMSRYTAFLVLESEEAYKRYNIKRRRKKTTVARIEPKVSGADLESVGQPRAQLTPQRLQPGDPEVHIPAPADAESVVVVFPFGETKVARYESRLRVWTVRFLVDKDTADGVYPVTIRITHRSGRVQVLRLYYVIDTKAPTVRLKIRKTVEWPTRYEMRAIQVATRAELHPDRVGSTEATKVNRGTRLIAGSPAGRAGKKRYARFVKDARRVDVRTPDGQVIPLGIHTSGVFKGYWRPNRPISGKVKLVVIAVDDALNRRKLTFRFDPATCSVSEGKAR